MKNMNNQATNQISDKRLVPIICKELLQCSNKIENKMERFGHTIYKKQLCKWQCAHPKKFNVTSHRGNVV